MLEREKSHDRIEMMSSVIPRENRLNRGKLCREGVRCIALMLVGCLAVAGSLVADDTLPDRSGEEFFEKNIRPLLVAHCYECHSAEGIKRSGRKTPGGNLLLDTRQN